MRVTFNSFPDNLVTQLGSLATRQVQLQTQASSGQRIQSADEDPTAMRRVLDLQADAQKLGQYQLNITSQQELATANYNALKALKTISDKAGEIATQAGGLASSDQLTALGRQVTELLKQAVSVANTKYGAEYLFGGTKTNQEPFALATDAAGAVTGVTYQGNESPRAVEIAPGSMIVTQVPGVNTTGSGPRGLFTDTAAGADFFHHLISLQNHLLAGDAAAVTASDQPQLLKDEDNLICQFGQNAAVQTRLDAAASTAGDQSQQLASQVSNAAGADMAQTLVRFSQTQTAYQAALQSGAKVLDLSLLNYLR